VKTIAFRAWIPTMNHLRSNKRVLAMAATALIGTGGAAAGAVAGNHTSTPTTPALAVASSGGATGAAPATRPVALSTPSAAPKKVAWGKQLTHDFQLQDTYYNCGPSATRVALSAHGKMFTQEQVGQMLGTTENGTNSAIDVTNALNQQLGAGRYHTVEIPGNAASQDDINKLKTEVTTAISHGDVVVANVAGTVTDTNGDTHSYQGGHYLPVVGFYKHGDRVTIADSADTVGSSYYNLPIEKLANWIATRGYAA
jgi:hypothetical protein